MEGLDSSGAAERERVNEARDGRRSEIRAGGCAGRQRMGIGTSAGGGVPDTETRLILYCGGRFRSVPSADNSRNAESMGGRCKG